LAEAIEIRGLLRRNTEELTGVMRALNGEYILPEAGGDLLRDGPGVLPTGVFFEKAQESQTAQGCSLVKHVGL
jgi:cobalamin biosynthesis Mg chelatase CobN